MTSIYATDSKLMQAQRDNVAANAPVNRYTGEPIEGQFPNTYKDPVSAGALTNFAKHQFITGGTALTLDASAMNNFIGREIILQCITPAVGTTLTLTGGLQFDGGAGSFTVCTFSATDASSVQLFFHRSPTAFVVSVFGGADYVLS